MNWKTLSACTQKLLLSFWAGKKRYSEVPLAAELPPVLALKITHVLPVQLPRSRWKTLKVCPKKTKQTSISERGRNPNPFESFLRTCSPGCSPAVETPGTFPTEPTAARPCGEKPQRGRSDRSQPTGTASEVTAQQCSSLLHNCQLLSSFFFFFFLWVMVPFICREQTCHTRNGSISRFYSSSNGIVHWGCYHILHRELCSRVVDRTGKKTKVPQC